jgi:hypothetical protein
MASLAYVVRFSILDLMAQLAETGTLAAHQWFAYPTVGQHDSPKVSSTVEDYGPRTV